jgi:hypothetical protein
MTFTVPELGALLLLGFVVAHALGVFANMRAIAAFFGVVLIGSAGFGGRVMTDIGGWVEHIFGSLTNWLVGVPLAAGLFIVLVFFVAHDLHPKNTAGPRTGLLALALGVIVAAGITGIPALAGLHNAIISAASALVR